MQIVSQNTLCFQKQIVATAHQTQCSCYKTLQRFSHCSTLQLLQVVSQSKLTTDFADSQSQAPGHVTNVDITNCICRGICHRISIYVSTWSTFPDTSVTPVSHNHYYSINCHFVLQILCPSFITTTNAKSNSSTISSLVSLASVQ